MPNTTSWWNTLQTDSLLTVVASTIPIVTVVKPGEPNTFLTMSTYKPLLTGMLGSLLPSVSALALIPTTILQIFHSIFTTVLAHPYLPLPICTFHLANLLSCYTSIFTSQLKPYLTTSEFTQISFDILSSIAGFYWNTINSLWLDPCKNPKTALQTPHLLSLANSAPYKPNYSIKIWQSMLSITTGVPHAFC